MSKADAWERELPKYLNTILALERMDLSGPDLDAFLDHIWSAVYTQRAIGLAHGRAQARGDSEEAERLNTVEVEHEGAFLTMLARQSASVEARYPGMIPGYRRRLSEWLSGEDASYA